MKIAFQKPNKWNLLERAISWWTHSKYCHVTLMFGDYVSWKHKVNMNFKPTLFSARSDRNPAVEFISWDAVNQQLFDVYDINWKIDEDILIEKAKKYVGSKYDYIGIFFNFILPLKIDEPKEWFCSEICSYLLKQGGISLNKHPYRYSPGSLFNELKRKHLISLSK